MSETIIFCESYGQIQFVLQLITENISDRKVTVIIPGHEDLYSLFKVFNEKVFSEKLELVYLQFSIKENHTGIFNKLLRLIIDIVKEKHYLNGIWTEYFKDKNRGEAYFLSRGYNGEKYYLLKKLSQNNKLIYIPPKGPPEMRRYTPKNLKHMAKLILFKLKYCLDIELGQFYTTRGFPWIPDQFIRKNVSRVIGADERDEMVRKLEYKRFKVFDTRQFRVMYFDDNSTGAGYFRDIGLFKQELAAILKVVLRYYSNEEIAYKFHPGYSGDKSLVETGTMLPSFAPAELLYNDSVQLYLSVFSRSIANAENGLAVSISELVTFSREHEREMQKKDIRIVSKSDILFPETIEEFERILIRLTSREKQDVS